MVNPPRFQIARFKSFSPLSIRFSAQGLEEAGELLSVWPRSEYLETEKVYPHAAQSIRQAVFRMLRGSL
jgi:hypothetical protein